MYVQLVARSSWLVASTLWLADPDFRFLAGQADLEEDDVYLLDLFNTIYVWVGSQARRGSAR